MSSQYQHIDLDGFKRRFSYDPDKDLLGKGGFSKVYKAYDNQYQRTVALKLYYGHLGERYNVLAEIDRMRQLRHPNIVQYFDGMMLQSQSIYDPDTQVQVAVIEYVNNGDLDDFLKSYPNKQRLNSIIKGMLRGLHYLHQNGIVHRDIKPQNILIHKDAQGKEICKIADFGLAKNLSKDTPQSSKLLGTMEYMAPEQFNSTQYGINGKLDTNVDLWSVGVILHEMFTGTLPFGNRNEGVTHEEMMFNIMKGELGEDIKSVEQPYRTAIEQCLIKSATDRIQTAQQLIDIIDGKDLPLNRPVVHQSTQRKVDRKGLSPTNRRLLLLANLIFTPILGIFLYLSWNKRHPRKAMQIRDIIWWCVSIYATLALLFVFLRILKEGEYVDPSYFERWPLKWVP